MAYILAVNPQVLSLAGVKGVSSDMKMDQGAIFVATALAAFVGSLFMGLIAKYPIALARNGIKCFLRIYCCAYNGNSMESRFNRRTFLWGVLCYLNCHRIKEIIINAIPYQMKMAVSAGIGLFITFGTSKFWNHY